MAIEDGQSTAVVCKGTSQKKETPYFQIYEHDLEKVCHVAIKCIALWLGARKCRPSASVFSLLFDP
jgi:hypothetical protein